MSQNQQGRPPERPRHLHHLRRSVTPSLVITLDLEGRPSVSIQAATLGDELRLRLWLRRSSALQHLSGGVQAALDELARRQDRAA